MSFSKPQQARSARTLEKMLAACERLLANRTFDQITMQELAQEAGISVGNLYNRFADKDALITYITERQQQGFEERFFAALAQAPDALGLKERVHLLAATFQREIAGLRPVYVALVTRADADAPRSARVSAKTDAIIEGAADWLMQHSGEMAGRQKQKRRRCRFVTASIGFTLQFDLLVGTPTRLFGGDLIGQVADQSYSYLTNPGLED